MTLDKSLLYHFVRDALGPYSEDFSLINKHNPMELRLNGITYGVHISYVHDSGENRDNEDEDRIQIQREAIELQRQRLGEGKRIAFVGFFEGGTVFSAWEPDYVFSQNPQKGGSVYARKSHKEQVEHNFAAIRIIKARKLARPSMAISLPATAFGFYLENIKRFHHLKTENAIQILMQEHTNAYAESGLGSYDEFDIGTDEDRVKFTYERKAFPRDPRFKRCVLAAYDRTCCICNRQLAIVQAAHIIPHSEPDSPNTVANGLALCIEHHRLYDDALLLPGPEQKLVFNKDRAEYLKQTNQERGLNEIAARHGSEYTVPESPKWHPSDEYLQRGLAIRMGQ